MRIASIVGARPQFIKAAPLSVELRRVHEEILIHTGQHYDREMSAVFFEELGIPEPDWNLGVGSGSHGWQTGQMLEKIEDVLLQTRPDVVVVHGDTNSTLAGALAAAKLQIPVAHVEAGLRSFRRDMPEEVNRVVADRLSQWLFAPSKVAVRNLAAEGITRGVYEVGDIMYDAIRLFAPVAEKRSGVLERLGLSSQQYAVATVHRAQNTDQPERLRNILAALRRIADRLPVVFPVHPRTRNALRRFGVSPTPISELPSPNTTSCSLRLIDPVSYLDMLRLVQNAAVLLTDSGGLQKEAYYLGTPCVTLREETEWPETIQAGWNILAGTEPEAIVDAFDQAQALDGAPRPALYGDGHTAQRIVACLTK